MVSNFLSSAGTSRGACEELADRLIASGASVITTSNRMGKIARLGDMVSTTWRSRKKYDVAQVDVYSGSAFVWAEAVCRVLRILGKPFVLTLHGGGLPEFGKRNPERVKRLLGAAVTVTAPSRFLYEAMSEYRSDLLLLPNSLDLSLYSPRLRKHVEPTLVWLRSLHEIYNPVLAVRVLALVKQCFPEAKLVMVGPDKGDGSSEAVLKEANRLGITSSVTLQGVVKKSKVPETLNQHDIFINTANIDNTPISVIEAMALGLCVVSTNVGGIPYLLTDNVDSLLTPRDDAQAMADAVMSLLSNQAIAESLSAKAIENVKKFDWEVTLPMWRSVLRDAIGKP